MAPFACRAVIVRVGCPFRMTPSEILEFNVPFCLGETCHYFNQCDLFHSFHSIVEVQFRGLAQLDTTVNNYKDNLNFLYCHSDMMLTLERALRNIIVCAYAYYINTWAMNGACVGHRTIRHYFIKEHKMKKIPPSTPMPAIDVEALLTDKEENLKQEQIRGTNPGILDLLGDPESPFYAKPLSMTKHFNTMIIGIHHLGDLPKHGHCKDSEMTTRVYKDEVRQVCQKILRCLDMRVLDGNIVVPTCLHRPTQILPHKRFLKLYFGPRQSRLLCLQVTKWGPGIPAAERRY